MGDMKVSHSLQLLEMRQAEMMNVASQEAMFWGGECLNKVRTEDVTVCTLGMVNICIWMMDLYIQNNR